jgi:hypothetical protein
MRSTLHQAKAQKVNKMQLTSAEQGLLLAGTLGFVTCVAFLHLGEAAILAAKLRAWMPLWWSGMLLLAAVILLVWRLGVDVSQGVRFSDVLVVFGGSWVSWSVCPHAGFRGGSVDGIANARTSSCRSSGGGRHTSPPIHTIPNICSSARRSAFRIHSTI